MDFIKLTHDELSVNKAMESVTSPNCGAVSLFVGTTRDNFEGKKVLSLEYEAYESMAEKTIKQICNDLRGKWNTIENIAIYHRLGKVAIKESSVIIAVSSPHRKDALEATQWCIDTLKQSVPIWKKEIYEDTDAQWKENAECTWSSDKNKSNKINFEFRPHLEYPKISSHLVQVTCSKEELDRRINSFMQFKREQANVLNIRDFCGNVAPGEGCARTNAKLRLLKDDKNKSHLRTKKVYNDLGPYKLEDNSKNVPYLSDGVEERITSIENNLNVMKPVPRDIYERIKKIEDRLLFLESISPEYGYFWAKDFNVSSNNEVQTVTTPPVQKQTFSLEYVDQLLYELEMETNEQDAS